MVDKQEIIHAYRRGGHSYRSLARELGLNRATVTKVLKEYEASLKSDDPVSQLNSVLTTSPSYDTTRRKPRLMTEEITNEIDHWLSENEKRRSSGFRKQRMNAMDIHRALQDKGMEISYSSVCKYIRRQREESRPAGTPTKNVFIKQRYLPGSQCEFDWGEVSLNIGGKRTKFMMAVFTLSYSNGRFAYLFRHQNTLALMEAHRNFFRDVQGVPDTMVYDNMRVAVAFTSDGKQPTEAMTRLKAFYRFNIRFCNARSGWEKGHVERSVEVVRSRAFKTRIDFDSIEDAQNWLDKTCHRLNTECGSDGRPYRIVAIHEDKEAMMGYPGEVGCYELVDLAVDKESTITYKYVHYSVPEHLARTHVIAKVYSEKIIIYDNDRHAVAEHERSYVKNDWVLDINHYLNTLLKKPGALSGSVAFQQMPKKMQSLYNRHFKDNGLDFLKLLKFSKENDKGYEDILAAAELVRKRGARKLTADMLKVAMTAGSAAPDGISDTAKASEEYMEIELGSEDILSQLSSIMTNKKRTSDGLSD